MLVFHRKEEQAVIISHPDGDVRMIIGTIERGLREDRVQVAFDAPRSVKILRAELVEQG